MKTVTAMVVITAVLLCGCLPQNKRLDSLESTNRQLKADIEKLRTQLNVTDDTNSQNVVSEELGEQLAAKVEALIASTVDALVTTKVSQLVSTRVDAVVAAELDSLVAAHIEKTVGTRDDISSIFESVFDETMANLEARKKTEEEEQREERRKEMDQRRIKREENRINRMAEDLKLNDEQKKQITKVSEATRQNMRDLAAKMREEGGFNMREYAETIRTQNDEAMREIMTDEQFQSFQERQQRQYGWLFNLLGTGQQPTPPQTTEQ